MAFTGTYVCNSWYTSLLAAAINASTDTFRVALYTSSATMDATTAAYTSTNELPTAGGYTAGGATTTCTVTTVLTQNGYVVICDFADVSWAAATFTARGAMLYDDTAAGNPAVMILDFGSDKTVTAGTFTVSFVAVANGSGPLYFGSQVLTS